MLGSYNDISGFSALELLCIFVGRAYVAVALTLGLRRSNYVNYLTFCRDSNGEIIYVYTDDSGKERIAYDRVNGEPTVLSDSKGNPVVNYYNATEKALIKEDAEKIMAQLKKGDTVIFDAMVEEYSEDKGLADFPNGYYVTEETLYESPEVIEALFKMNVGDYELVESDYGFHLIMRYEIEDAAYTKDEYKDIFISNSTGTYVFMSSLTNELFASYIKPYKAKIVVDKEVLNSADIKRAGINYYY